MKHYNKFLISIVIASMSPLVLAHTGTHSGAHSGAYAGTHSGEVILNNLIIGLSHPVSGVDHLIVLLLAGFLVFRCGNKKILMFGAIILSPSLAYGVDASVMSLSFMIGFMLTSSLLIYLGGFIGRQLTVVESVIKVNNK
ncbi:hypothetical protein MNBD_GAMMA06-428 [hydrothermal vent metagenome]|uniref:HupE-UreJ family metal transporter n=1 Tax=hydrothermal vent metagenome TaxID=652676 RepID=A0A3B0WEF8_9ZZZZ